MSANGQQLLDVDEERYSITLTGTQVYTWYNCCVEARYTNPLENASTCVVGSITEGGGYSLHACNVSLVSPL